MQKNGKLNEMEGKIMDYKYHYYFRFHYTAPGKNKPDIYSSFYVNRCAPIDSHLYYKVRRRAFGSMNSMYWACNVEIYGLSKCEDPTNIYVDSDNIKYLGSFTFDRYTYTTYFAAFARIFPGIKSLGGSSVSGCTNWVEHSTSYDWSNHAEHNPSMRI